jgi:DnaJ-class molecular chaperone
MTECPSCEGTGEIDIGDCEEGVTDVCPQCNGEGEIADYDVFVPERDAFTFDD